MCLLHCAGKVKCIFAGPSSHVPRLPSFLTLLQNAKPTRLALLLQRAESIAPATQTTLERPKAVRTCGVFACFCHFDIFWLGKRASRHKGAHFVNISAFSTSKNAPDPSFFFKNSKCASRHNLVHFLKGSTSKSAPTMVCFWHPNLLRATAGCNFWSLIWRDGSAPAVLASLLLTLQGRKTLQNHSVSRLFYLFVRPGSSFFWLFLFSDLLYFFLFFLLLSFFLFFLFSSFFVSSFFLLSSFFFLLSSFFFLLSSFFFLLLLSSFLFSSLLLSSPLFSSLLFSSLLFSDSSHLCCCISPYCRKFDFETSFGKVFLKFWRHDKLNAPSPSKIVKLLHF